MPQPTPLTSDPIGLARDNWIKHGWDGAADGMALVTSIMRVQQVFLSRVEAILRPNGLTFARFEVLRLLAFSRSGVMSVGRIGQRLQVHPASVTNAVQRLEADGLIVRTPNPTDRRGVLAEITADGRALVELSTVSLNEEIFSRLPLTPAELRATFEMLRDLRRSFGDFD